MDHVSPDFVKRFVQDGSEVDAEGASADEAAAPDPGAAAHAATALTRVLVGGAAGGGKSICLASTAEALRQKGW